MEQGDEWLTLAEAHALLHSSIVSRVSLRTLQRSLHEDARRARHWERVTDHGRETGWTRRQGIERVEYLVKRSWVQRKVDGIPEES